MRDHIPLLRTSSPICIVQNTSLGCQDRWSFTLERQKESVYKSTFELGKIGTCRIPHCAEYHSIYFKPLFKYTFF